MFAVEVYYNGYHCGNLCRDDLKWTFTVGADRMKFAKRFTTREEADKARDEYLAGVLSFKAKVVPINTVLIE